MDAYTDLYKRVKNDLINNKLESDTHYPFCEFLSNLYQIRAVACELSRLPRNHVLRLEIIIFNDSDLSIVEIGNWQKIKINKVDQVRKEYKNVVLTNDRFDHLHNQLSIKEQELDNLFVIASSFTDNLRWDLNINLDNKKQEALFDHHFGKNNYRVLKEFEMILVLLKNDQKKSDFDSEKIEVIRKEYNTLLDKTSPIKGIFNINQVHLSIEDELDFLDTYGNLRNYLN